jgi:hypothetical protein
LKTALGLLTAALLVTGRLVAQPAPESGSAEGLAKQLSNPVADLVSVPLQFNWDQPVGPDDSSRFLINFQPVVPFKISEKWNMIARWIMPYLSQPVLAPGGAPSSGLGDIVYSTFFSPREVEHAIWGIGPVFSLPTSTDPLLGSGKWSVGPTFVVLKQSGPWTYGALAHHLVSFADATDAPRSKVNLTYLQPFAAHGWKNGVTVTVSSESSANWEADDVWTVPVIAQISKVTRLGPFPFSVGAGLGYYAVTPGNEGPDWKLRTTFTLILPNKK